MAYNRFLLSTACLLVSLPALAQTSGAGNGGPGVPVTIVKPMRQDVPITIRGLAQVAPLNNVVLHPRVDGTLDKVNFAEGSMVHAGDVLAVIDPRPYQAVLDAALAKKASDVANQINAKHDLERYAQLAVNQFAAQQQVDTQRALVVQLDATIKGDDAAIAAAQLNLDFTKIIAPFDGRVGLRLTDLGNFIRSADTTNPGIVTLSQIQPVTVTFSVPQDNLPSIAAAMANGTPQVHASSADGKSTLGDGTLITIDNSIDPTTGTIKVKATFPNGELKLWPGQFVNTTMQVGQQANAISLPSQAVQHGPDGLFVYVVKPDNTVAIAPVNVSLDTGTLAAIASGVSEGDTVVLSGQSRLRPGVKVSIVTGSGS
ncbi:MAG: efflux RND transporter periplasmic adaptor subunit [Acetobacteraceae bacterium]|nr:efflux RND transporter periplasmic adaptor subunit [Acetobacteraceae bacterium]